MVVAHASEVFQIPRCQSTRVLASPALATFGHFHVQEAALLHDAEVALVLRLLDIDLKAQRLHEGIPEPNIRQPRFFQINLQRQDGKLGGGDDITNWKETDFTR